MSPGTRRLTTVAEIRSAEQRRKDAKCQGHVPALQESDVGSGGLQRSVPALRQDHLAVGTCCDPHHRAPNLSLGSGHSNLWPSILRSETWCPVFLGGAWHNRGGTYGCRLASHAMVEQFPRSAFLFPQEPPSGKRTRQERSSRGRADQA